MAVLKSEANLESFYIGCAFRSGNLIGFST